MQHDLVQVKKKQLFSSITGEEIQTEGALGRYFYHSKLYKWLINSSLQWNRIYLFTVRRWSAFYVVLKSVWILMMQLVLGQQAGIFCAWKHVLIIIKYWPATNFNKTQVKFNNNFRKKWKYLKTINNYRQIKK